MVGEEGEEEEGKDVQDEEVDVVVNTKLALGEDVVVVAPRRKDSNLNLSNPDPNPCSIPEKKKTRGNWKGKERT